MRRGPALAAALGLLALVGCTSAPAGSTVLQVYAAASLAPAFDDLVADFEVEHPGVEVVTVYDGSSTLATQIAAGAPADVFASADEATMAKVGDAAADPRVFASNTLVIAVPSGNPAGVEALADLARATTVLCAPEVPCGAASQKLLARSGVELAPASLEQNVMAVLAKVATGEADAGLVYATDARGADGVGAVVPEGAQDVVNRYPISVTRGAAHAALAREFVAYVLSDTGRAALVRAGFGTP